MLSSSQLELLSRTLSISPSILSRCECEELSPIRYKFILRGSSAVYDILKEEIVEESGSSEDIWSLRVLLNDLHSCKIFSSKIVKIVDKTDLLQNIHILDQECYLEIEERFVKIILTKRGVPTDSYIFNRSEFFSDGMTSCRIESTYYTYYIIIKRLTESMLEKTWEVVSYG